MITSAAYEQQDFGWFRITDRVGGGAEAEVFHCVHVAAGRTYILRLHIDDDEIWERAEPMLPPRNQSLEHDAAISAARLSGEFLRNSPLLRVTELYGVRDGRYLIPLTNCYRRKGAVPFERILETSIPFQATPFWENLGLLAQVETSLLESGTITLETWIDRWSVLLGDASLRSWIEDAKASIPPALRTKIDESLAKKLVAGPSLEESAIARIITSRLASLITAEELDSSLRCPFFRMNITLRDLAYTVALLQLYQEAPWIMQGPVEWLGPRPAQILIAIADGLSVQPDKFDNESDEFEYCAPPPEDKARGYSLIIQDMAAAQQGYFTLEHN